MFFVRLLFVNDQGLIFWLNGYNLIMKKRFNKLPNNPPPPWQYVTTVKTGNLLFVSGHGPKLVGFDDFDIANLPISKNKTWITGRLGEGITVEI